ncbi:MAG: type IV pilin [Nitrososphaerota archaeon]
MAGGSIMEKLSRLFKDQRGLSDAVAIALFVGVALVMGTLIASFALSKAPTAAAPTVSISIGPIATGTVGIFHKGGDGVPFEHLRIYVYNAADMSNVSGYPKLANDTSITKVDLAPNNVFNNGDVLRLSLSAGSYKIAVEYVPTRQTIAEAIVTVG